MTAAHELKKTLHIDVNDPAHADRVETKLYRDTRSVLLKREGGRCWVCGRDEKESGKPLQTHHHPVERSLANMIDFRRVEKDCRAGEWGHYAQQFDWEKFWEGAKNVTLNISAELRAKRPDLPETITYLKPVDPYLFVDDMRVNGKVLCAEHHIESDTGIHETTFPMLLGEKYGIDGYEFIPDEALIHD